MGTSSRYWNIWRINLQNEKVGYKSYLVPPAQEFVAKEVVNQTGDTQAALLSYFHGKNSAEARVRAQAGLCLRCYISNPILKACQKIDNLFGGDKSFTYRDLLSFVLNDDGKTLVILDSDRKTQLVLNDNNQVQPITYKFFSVKVLQTFKSDSHSRMSLDNWTYLQTKQNPELKDFLSEFGFQHLSDWALLNRTRPKQLERFSLLHRHLVEVFHIVYRRDRVQQRQAGIGKCPDPNNTQLQEMIKHLQERGVIINATLDLIKGLKEVARILRQYDIWSSREPLEVYDPDAKSYTPRGDLPTDFLNELELEQREILDLLHSSLKSALCEAINKEIHERISTLEKSKKYSPLAKQFIPGLQLYYEKGLSLKEIAPILGMTSWDQTRRILNPGEFLTKVRDFCVQQVVKRMLELAIEKGLTKIPPEPDYLKTLAEEVETFVDEEIFKEAAEEIRAGKNRSMDSLYAQQLCIALKNTHQCV